MRMLLFISLHFTRRRMHEINRRKWEQSKGNAKQGPFRHSEMELLSPLLPLQPGIKVSFRSTLPCAAVQGRSHMLLPYPGPSSETENLLSVFFSSF